MSTQTRFPAERARALAKQIVEMLSPVCHRIEIAGSLRRGKPTVGDIEILYVPRVEPRPIPGDLFNTKDVSLADELIDQWLRDGKIEKRPKTNGTFSWGDLNKLAVHVNSGIPIDFFATSLANWWVSLVVRTGSAESNMRLTTAAQRDGKSLLAYGSGVRQPDGSVIDATSEQHVFELCGVDYLKPEDRR